MTLCSLLSREVQKRGLYNNFEHKTSCHVHDFPQKICRIFFRGEKAPIHVCIQVIALFFVEFSALKNLPAEIIYKINNSCKNRGDKSKIDTD